MPRNVSDAMRYDDTQAAGRGDELFERTTVVQPVAGRDVDACLDFFLHVGNKRTQVALANICRDENPALAVFPADLVRAVDHFNVCYLAE
jgi:hypothetical protein